MSSNIDLRHLSPRLKSGEIVRLTGRDGGDQYVRVLRASTHRAAFHVLDPFAIGQERQQARGRRWYVDLDEVMARGAA